MADNRQTSRRLDPITLVLGLLTLFASGYVLSDGRLWFPQLDLRWIFAGGAVLVGLLLLGSSLRNKGKRK
ncbi:hypothetical protein V5P93_006730 [Actinokineospora auranticolor]|uniref:Uncharacterized protein n=1 Tax=Actinokineospora auranticolor TaxID=155976 RepID=A0A2S6GWQ8_9PSEU|nr:hypothetical protein [Actinokineospora auranticolor]PPK69626.1 hypothetical protein CLV40_103236 [Actinokineospora auranticolor]